MSVSDDFNDDNDKTAVLAGDQETLRKELETAKQQAACLIIIRGKPQGHRYFLTQKEMFIGRHPSAEICVADQSISKKHAVVHVEGNRIRLSDAGSSNGTFINGKKLSSGESVLLAKEDMVKIGSTILKYLPQGELEILYLGNLGSAAHTDAMTKLYNKGYLIEALDAEFKRAKALNSSFSVLFFDIDHFKPVNDTHGHDAGDHILKEFSALIKNRFIGPKDILARYGGEEFVILFSGKTAEESAEIAEQIRVAIETNAFIYEGTRIPITSSIGIAELTATTESAQTLLKAADKALYDAKNSGRNNVKIAR
jgi:two-component system, cell cycle response regulator